MRKKVLQLVDSVQYISQNCFQHQLHNALFREYDVTVVPISRIYETHNLKGFDCIVSTLKQRTLLRYVEPVSSFLGDRELVVYDQDPWESFRDGSEFKGSYKKINKHISVAFFAVTTSWWNEYINTLGMPAKFVKMGVLPWYCDVGKSFVDRTITYGFIGTLHEYRKRLFVELAAKNYDVTIKRSENNYASFLSVLGNMKIFVHNEDIPITIDGNEANIGTGLWIKDVEACSRGAFSVRNRLPGHETYLEGLETVYLYDSFSEVPTILDTICGLDEIERQAMIDRTVAKIKENDAWLETAHALTETNV